MMERKERNVFEVVQLILHSFLGNLKEEERKRYEQTIYEGGLLNNGKELGDRRYIISELRKPSYFDSKKAYKNLKMHMRKKKRMCMQKVQWVAAVLVVFLLIGSIGSYFFLKTEPVVFTKTTDICPVHPKAYITLTDGLRIDLTQGERKIAEKDGTVICRDSTKVIYNRIEHSGKTKLIYNDLNVPRGGEYMLVLSDGTNVWMNADSRLRFPVQFGMDCREVYLTGEAYFEVTKDDDKPFKVHTSLGVVSVLGTEFNVRDYPDERKVETTLVKGSVKYEYLHVSSSQVVLKPGYQSLADDVAGNLEIRKVDVREYVGWKDGLYIFNHLTLGELMRTIERTYDVNVFFVNERVKHLRFSGDLQKYERVELFLRYIEMGGDVRFVIKDRTISVYEK